MLVKMLSPLLQLPSELIQHIFEYLDLIDLVNIAKTCRRLREQSYDDQSWRSIVNGLIHSPVTSAAPYTFRDLFLAHHPHWFLAAHRIWFGDSEPCGKLVLARYNGDDHSIAAYTVVAKRGPHKLSFWERDPEVIIHSFDPIVSLDTTKPVLRITPNCKLTGDRSSPEPGGQSHVSEKRYTRELAMETSDEEGLHSSFIYCRSLPAAAISHGTSVWPPLRLPAVSRTRNETSDRFRSSGHRPTKLDDLSQSTFRVRRWVQFGNRQPDRSMSLASPSGIATALGFGMSAFTNGSSRQAATTLSRVPEQVTTYATLPEYCYTPTARKPWQGIWCGDYSGHGCEFLVITQPDAEDERPLPSNVIWDPREWGGWFDGASHNDAPSAASTGTGAADAARRPNMEEEPTGRIEAIKLTGDVNVPRGEYTFIAPDISNAGLVRVADEETFRGARVVRSAGHIAGRGFRHDQYMPSQLIMISHDKLAQHWEGFGHISYYQRVDLDALMKVADSKSQ